MRKARKGEVLCDCRAYPFRHRMTGGLCEMEDFVAEYFSDNSWGDCRACPSYQFDGGPECDVLDGREAHHECPAAAGHLDAYGVPVPTKMNKKSWG